MHTAARLCWGAVTALFALPLAAQQPPGLDVPYVPSPPEVVAQMLALANPTRDDVLYDLGSGDGRIVIEAARRFGTRGVGVDLNPVRVEEATANARRRGLQDRVRFHRQDLFETDLRPASIVTLYLFPHVNLELRPKLFEQLRPGTRVVSHAFDMVDWEPDTVVRVRVNQGTGRAMVYAWTIPAQVAGRWTLTTPEGRRVCAAAPAALPTLHRAGGERTTGGGSDRLHPDGTGEREAGDPPLLRPGDRRRDEREGRRWRSVEGREGTAWAPR